MLHQRGQEINIFTSTGLVLISVGCNRYYYSKIYKKVKNIVKNYNENQAVISHQFPDHHLYLNTLKYIGNTHKGKVLGIGIVELTGKICQEIKKVVYSHQAIVYNMINRRETLEIACQLKGFKILDNQKINLVKDLMVK